MFSLITTTAMAIFLTVWFYRLPIHPLLSIDLASPPSMLAAIGSWTLFPMLSTVIFDFFYYWYHRSQHAFRTMWRVHSVHHSLEELNVFNSYHHVLEPILTLPFLVLPMGLLIRISLPEAAIAAFVFKLSDTMIHANSRISYGWIKYLIAEPRYHRIHHSIEGRHWNKNFAFYFPVWDVIFGTAYFPAKDEFPKTGVQGKSEARSLRSYLARPFIR
jgi:sterol desaturase/sphingolipid hydroxylase (fatty acid hydroxylase superfamily)